MFSYTFLKFLHIKNNSIITIKINLVLLVCIDTVIRGICLLLVYLLRLPLRTVNGTPLRNLDIKSIFQIQFHLSVLFLQSVSSLHCNPSITAKGLWLCVGGLLKPKTVCQHHRLLVAQMFLSALSAQ